MLSPAEGSVGSSEALTPHSDTSSAYSGSGGGANIDHVSRSSVDEDGEEEIWGKYLVKVTQDEINFRLP